MIRLTRKYRLAIEIAPNFSHSDRDSLYSHLVGMGYWWNGQAWAFVEPEDSHPPSSVIRIRVMTASKLVAKVATELAERFELDGYTLSDTSRVYPCRPPNNNDGRVYLTFIPPEGWE
ncbi:hypothetical protein B9T07_22850 [Limnospira fusiformis CCALA 023]